MRKKIPAHAGIFIFSHLFHNLCCKTHAIITGALRQQSNYERWVNATSSSDTRYNSVNSYAMLHIRYRLNMFGGKVDTEGRYDKKWGNNDRRR